MRVFPVYYSTCFTGKDVHNSGNCHASSHLTAIGLGDKVDKPAICGRQTGPCYTLLTLCGGSDLTRWTNLTYGNFILSQLLKWLLWGDPQLPSQVYCIHLLERFLVLSFMFAYEAHLSTDNTRHWRKWDTVQICLLWNFVWYFIAKFEFQTTSCSNISLLEHILVQFYRLWTCDQDSCVVTNEQFLYSS